MKRFNLILYSLLWHKTNAFLPRSSRPSIVGPLGVVTEPSSVTETEEDLSDTDSRVLESMLQDSKLDLETEADIRKLLERETVDASIGCFESVGIWIGNKVEQDVKTLAALGFFAWERAVRDVGRALPQAGEISKKTVFLITNSSSAGSDAATQQNIKDRMLRPQDEIQTVSREIRGILSGQQRSSSGRNLRTIAPAGSSNNAERLRRAYQQSRRAEKDAKDLTKVPGKVVDGVFELRQELRAETNEPGYKSKPIRNAIAAGVANTGNLLQSVKEQARLAAAKRKEERLLRPQDASFSKNAYIGIRIEDRVRAASTTENVIDPYVAARLEFEKSSKQSKTNAVEDIDVLELLRGERRRVLMQLAACVDKPSKTWLVGFSIDDGLDNNSLIDIVTKMVVLRNDIEEREEFDDEKSAGIVLSHLREIKGAVDDILQTAETFLSSSRIEALEAEIYRPDPAYGETPLILLLDGIETTDDLNILLQRQLESMSDSETRSVQTTPEIVDVITETRSKSVYHTAERCDKDLTDQYEQYVMPSAAVEVVVDDDIFEAADRAKKTTEVTESEENQQESEVVKLALRSLDVIFFVVEKTLFAAIPQVVSVSTTAFRRAMAVNELGRGSRGWEQYSKLDNTRAKY